MIDGTDLDALEREFIETRESSIGGSVEFETPDRWSIGTEALFGDDGTLWVQNGFSEHCEELWTVVDLNTELVERVRLPDGFRLRFLRDGGTLETVERNPPRHVTWTSGSDRRIVRLAGLGDATIEAAYHTGDAWYFLTRESPSSLAVYQLDISRPERIATIRKPEIAWADAVYFRASAGRLVVSTRDPPFDWLIIGPGATERLVAGTPLEPHGKVGSGTWIAGPVLPLHADYVQSVIDLTSDARVVRRFDRNGRLLQRTRYNVPFALLESIPSRELVLGTDALDGLHILAFRESSRECSDAR